MNISLLNLDLRNLPKLLFFSILIFYPFFSYVIYKGTGTVPNYLFGFICFGVLILRLYAIYRAGQNLVIPSYILIFGIFTAYVILSSIFVSDLFLEKGAIKYFYSNPFLMTFMVFLYIENIHISFRSLKFAKRILEFTLILASVVSIIQISNPLFFINDELFIQGLSVDRMAEYYKSVPQAKLGTNGEAGYVDRFLKGYRLSIFSYINSLSVGIDTLAIFSILLTWKPVNFAYKGLFIVSTAIISFLSSARWIMLGFMVVASHTIWLGKNKLNNFMYFMLSGVVLLTFLVLIANLIGFDIEKFTSERLVDDSASTRLLAFEVFFEVFPDNPVLGTGGVDTEKVLKLLDGKSSQIHVGFLKLFYYYGLIGGLLYLSFMLALLVRLRKMAKQSGYWGGFIAILTFFIANLTLVELSLFYYGPLLAIVFANHFYFNKLEDKISVGSNLKTNDLSVN